MNVKLKALLALILAICCLVSTAACDDKNPADTGSDDATQAMGESSEEVSSADPDAKPVYSDTDADGNAQRDPNYKVLNYDTMKGIWISQYDISNVFKSTNEKAFSQSINRIFKAISESGFNTVVVQLRPNGDSFFPSEVYPSSNFVVASHGAPFRFDPLKHMVKIAHEYDLSFHAWINPMRLMSSSEIKNISTDYKIGEWYQNGDKFISLYDGRYYLVPGFAETRNLVCAGIEELIQNYNIDAVHIDDYFYPTANYDFDDAHYKPVEENYSSRKEYRLAMVDALVKQMYDTVKKNDPDMPFGISPAGSITNNLNTLFANVRKWCSMSGFCDYIVPQVYWGFEHPRNEQKFDVCCEEWEKLCTSPDVKLVIGVGIYRAEDIDPGEFQELIDHKDVFKRQLEYLQGMDKNDGFVMYSYKTMFTVTGKYQNKFAEERENMLPVLKAFGEEAE